MIRELHDLELELINIYPVHICVKVFRQKVKVPKDISSQWNLESALYRSTEMAEENHSEARSVKCIKISNWIFSVMSLNSGDFNVPGD